MIYGPVGDRRLDAHFAYLTHAVVCGYAETKPKVEDMQLKYDYRRHFPKDALTEIARAIENVDADVAKIMAFGKRLRGGG